MSFFSAFEHPEKFGYAGVFSPAFLCYTREDWEKYLSTKIVENMPFSVEILESFNEAL